MSSFFRETKHPKTGKWEVAAWIDDYFDEHKYGIKFANDQIFKEEEIKEFKITVT